MKDIAKKIGIAILLVFTAIMLTGASCFAATSQEQAAPEPEVQWQVEQDSNALTLLPCQAIAIDMQAPKETRYTDLEGENLKKWLKEAVCDREYLVVSPTEEIQTALVHEILKNRSAGILDLMNFRSIDEGLSIAHVLKTHLNRRDAVVIRVTFKEEKPSQI